jgi:putative hydrolase of the HAD superfamily
MKTVRAVTFDFWNTLVVEPGGVVSEMRYEALRAACATAALDVDEESLRACLAEVQRRHSEAWTGGGMFLPRDAAELVAETLGGGPEFATAFLDAPASAELRLTPNIGEALETLRARGVRLGIICDVGLMRSELLRGFLDRAGVLEHFDHWAFSDDVGHFKPSPEIFGHALDGLGVDDPADAVHIGDLRRTDVAGARAAGMGTIRYRGIADDLTEGPEADAVLDDHADLAALLSGDRRNAA